MDYGLIGEHLPHSFSKEIHGRCANYKYELKELSPGELPSFLKERAFQAINVTIPYKQAVIPYLTALEEQALNIGAVNTVVNRNGALYGYNTDFYGLTALIRHMGISLKGKKVLILGTGGTSRTAQAVARAEQGREIVALGREKDFLTEPFSMAYEAHGDAEILINTTPCGMYPYEDGAAGRAGIPVDISRFPSLCGVVDAVYNPLRTNLVLAGKARGIPSEGGLYMLVAQAVKASRIFMGNEDEDSSIVEEIRNIYEQIRSQKENIVLTGMPGSGKSTAGKVLANALGKPFFDTDDAIVQAEGRSIRDIFASEGEEGFRAIESRVIRDMAKQVSGCVIATGGGAVLKDENVRALKRTGRIYFLDRSPDAILPTEDRPLASTVEAIRQRYAERYDRYVATCDRKIIVDEKIEHTVFNIRKDFLS